MAIPIPSDDRSIQPRRFRGAPREHRHLEQQRPWVHHNHDVRRHEQQVFEASPTNMVTRGLSQVPPEQPSNHTSLKMVPQPRKASHPEGRRNPHRIPPLSEDMQQSIYPQGGMVRRPAVQRAASSMAHATDAHVIHAHISPDGVSHPGKRIYAGTHERSTRGDMSLMRNGVKRVELTQRNHNPNDAVTGFRGMGRFSNELDDGRMGKKSVTPQPWDPLHYFEEYGRRHPAPVPSCKR